MRRLNPYSRFVMKHAGLVATLGLLLAAVSTYFSVLLYKNLRTDVEELLPTHARSGQDLEALTKRLDSFDSFAILAFSKDVNGSRKFVDALAAKLELELPRELAAYVEYKIDKEMKFFKDRLALYLDMDDLKRVEKYIKDRIYYEKEFYSPLNIFPVSDRIKKPELDFTALRQKYGTTSAYQQFPGGYYATQNEEVRAVLVYQAGKHSDIHRAHELRNQIDRIVRELNPKSFAADIEVKYTGDVESLLEEHAALIADLELSSIIVIVLVTLVMLVFYRDVRSTLLLILALFAGTLWTFALSYFLVGYLNANSAFLGSIVIGNGINFGLILLARYVEERRKGRNNIRATDIAFRNTTTATLTAALAAGLSYGSLMLTRFRGFRQFGVIGFIGMVLCWISSFTLLPAFLVIADKIKKKHYPRKQIPRPLPYAIAHLVEKGARPITAIMAILVVFSFAMFPRISPKMIETDLNQLRNKTSLRVGAGFLDRYVIEIFQRYLSPIVILPQTREQAIEIARRLLDAKKREGKDSLIARVQTLEDFTPGEQEEKIKVLRRMKQSLTPQVVASLEGDEKKWVDDYLTPAAFKTFTEDDLPWLVKKKFSERDGSRGKIVLVEPPLTKTGSVVSSDGKIQVGFIKELRDIADSVLPGVPVSGQLPISSDMFESITKEGPIATLCAFIAVFVLVIILFRDIKSIAFTVFALLLGVLWLLGIMLGFNLKINFLNFIALPITFGIGVDYGVNIFQRYRLEGRGSILSAIRHTGGAVILASTTTIIGYCSLVIAENQAFVSFGTLAVLGEVTCVTAAVLFLPAFIMFLDEKWRKTHPVDDYSVVRRVRSTGPSS